MLDPEPVTMGRKDGTMGRGGTGKHGWNMEGSEEGGNGMMGGEKDRRTERMEGW
jgi:hypothetical protein